MILNEHAHNIVGKRIIPGRRSVGSDLPEVYLVMLWIPVIAICKENWEVDNFSLTQTLTSPSEYITASQLQADHELLVWMTLVSYYLIWVCLLLYCSIHYMNQLVYSYTLRVYMCLRLSKRCFRDWLLPIASVRC